MFGNSFLTDVQTSPKRARAHIGDGQSQVGVSIQRETVLNLLDEAFAAETMCVMRYYRYQFLRAEIDTGSFVEKFVAHTPEEQHDREMATLLETMPA